MNAAIDYLESYYYENRFPNSHEKSASAMKHRFFFKKCKVLALRLFKIFVKCKITQCYFTVANRRNFSQVTEIADIQASKCQYFVSSANQNAGI